MTGPDPRKDELRSRQRGRNVALAIALLAFSVLMFAITIARMAGGE